jgi:hypothetical protein
MLLMELLRTVPDRCPPEQGRRSELDRYRLWLGMRVSHQHPWVSVAANGSDFRHVETLLEEPVTPRDEDRGTSSHLRPLAVSGAPMQA